MLLLGVQHKFKHDAKPGRWHGNQTFEKCFEIEWQWGSWQNSPMLSFLFSFTEKENYVDGTCLVAWDSLLHYFHYASAKNNHTDCICVLYLCLFYFHFIHFTLLVPFENQCKWVAKKVRQCCKMHNYHQLKPPQIKRTAKSIHTFLHQRKINTNCLLLLLLLLLSRFSRVRLCATP